MADSVLNSGVGKKFVKNSNISNSIINMALRFEGHNLDITEPYFWHMNFAYYVGKGYKALKVEDYHYFTENNQFGSSLRQMKGQSIGAFQQNIQSLITLIRNHLMPLLDEIKKAAFYKEWFDKISENDSFIQEELKKSSPNNDNLKKWRDERDEAIRHMKDNWVNSVDGAKLWQLSRQASEQGLDFALLPQLFFGIGIDDPFQKSRTLKEQLDQDIYPVDISLGAKEQVANYIYRFYTWLPTAIKDTEVTFKLKISALKNIYAQVEMYINFMKPLLMEITKKSEGLEKQNFYRDFDSENPEFINMFDYSYSFVKILGIRGFEKENYKISDLEFTRHGLYLRKEDLIISGKYKGQSGFIMGETEGGKYLFYPCGDKDVEKIDKFKIVELSKNSLKVFPVMIFDFYQRRRNEIKQTQQGPMQVPFMRNQIDYLGHVWNIYEIAVFRESVKIDNLQLLETFIDEIKIIKEDLIKYANYYDMPSDVVLDNSSSSNSSKEKSSSKKSKSGSSDRDFVFGPFKGLAEMFSPLIPSFNVKFKDKKKEENISENVQRHYLNTKLRVLEDTWKVYTIFKKSHGYIQY